MRFTKYDSQLLKAKVNAPIDSRGLDIPALVKRYRAGASINKLSIELKISRFSIRAMIAATGEAMRGHAESSHLKEYR